MLSKLNYLNVGDDGTFRKTGKDYSTPEDVDALIEFLKTQDKLVIHFHGGLIKESAGMQIAEKLSKSYKGAHPLTIVWETGLLETVQDRITDVYKTKLFKKLLLWVAKKASKYLPADFQIGTRGAKELTDAEILDELNNERPFEHLTPTLSQGAKGADFSLTEMELDNLIDEIEAELETEIDMTDPQISAMLTGYNAQKITGPQTSKGQARGISVKLIKDLAKLSVQVIRRLANGTHHGLYPTIVEEILQQYYLADVGEWVWGGMKLSAQEMWQENTNLSGVEQHAGTYLLEKLIALQQQHHIKIDIVGHSAGAIAICHLFKAMKQRQQSLDIRNLIFLAPAARYDLFIQHILPQPNFYQSFKMYTMSDQYECNDMLVPYVYTRSLLYFISGVLEGKDDMPIIGMERYISQPEQYKENAFAKVRDFMRQDNRLILSNSSELNPGAVAPFITTSETHGDFDDDEATISSINTLLQEG
ncbi:alpha/beta hydrolase [Vibrio rhizosphaerae]|uniref:Alpha/beta hydrolase n=1 Tax=Vibrio rhizosphaerae TaxID=398736 RepID=A0ABU4IY91_9VIBR|nr:alpha/beta hydrolase [Vibrio rhizosphaerae]MDW6094374.1 alpha/beta hydrolase [Vibrio rhizosphaerae]